MIQDIFGTREIEELVDTLLWRFCSQNFANFLDQMHLVQLFIDRSWRIIFICLTLNDVLPHHICLPNSFLWGFRVRFLLDWGLVNLGQLYFAVRNWQFDLLHLWSALQ